MSFSLEIIPSIHAQKNHALFCQLKELRCYPITSVHLSLQQANHSTMLSFIDQEYERSPFSYIPHVHFTADRNAIASALTQFKQRQIKSLMVVKGQETLDPSNNFIPFVNFLSQQHGFNLIATAYPEKHRGYQNPACELDYLKRKIDAGATTLLTQCCTHGDIFLRYRDWLSANNIHIPIIPNILISHRSHWFKQFCRINNITLPQLSLPCVSENSDFTKALTEHNIALISHLRKEGTSHIHLSTMNHIQTFKEIIDSV